jgi:hypothetical protein
MKNLQSLAIFIALILFSSIICLNDNKLFEKEKPFRGYFYIQRFYPGNDILESISESEFSTNLMFFEVNKDVIFFTKSLARIKDIEGKFYIKKKIFLLFIFNFFSK